MGVSLMPIYYHATPYENFVSIMREGLRLSFGEIYCSTVPDTAACWVSFTRRNSSEIMTIPFHREDDDPRMKLGCDHSPIMTRMLGVDDETASFVSNEAIPSHDILWDEVRIWKNPWAIKGDEKI